MRQVFHSLLEMTLQQSLQLSPGTRKLFFKVKAEILLGHYERETQNCQRKCVLHFGSHDSCILGGFLGKIVTLIIAHQPAHHRSAHSTGLVFFYHEFSPNFVQHQHRITRDDTRKWAHTKRNHQRVNGRNIVATHEKHENPLNGVAIRAQYNRKYRSPGNVSIDSHLDEHVCNYIIVYGKTKYGGKNRIHGLQ